MNVKNVSAQDVLNAHRLLLAYRTLSPAILLAFATQKNTMGFILKMRLSRLLVTWLMQ